MIDLREEKIVNILEHYGDDAQLLKAIEELTELSMELWGLYKENPGSDGEVVTSKARKVCIVCEIADVFVMLEQLQLICGIEDRELNAMMDYKVDRTLDRIRNNE